jgi:hypothetical protein
MSVGPRKLHKTSPKSVTKTCETSICMRYCPSVPTNWFYRRDWSGSRHRDPSQEWVSRGSDHVKSSDFTTARDSKSSLPILKMVLYIFEFMKNQSMPRSSKILSKSYCHTEAGGLPRNLSSLWITRHSTTRTKYRRCATTQE